MDVNRSAGRVADVPPLFVVVISTVPPSKGTTALIWLSDTTLKLVAETLPKFTAVTPALKQ
jgi:hypothetical protein